MPAGVGGAAFAGVRRGVLAGACGVLWLGASGAVPPRAPDGVLASGRGAVLPGARGVVLAAGWGAAPSGVRGVALPGVPDAVLAGRRGAALLGVVFADVWDVVLTGRGEVVPPGAGVVSVDARGVVLAGGWGDGGVVGAWVVRRVGGWVVGRCRVLVMTLCMGVPVSWARWIPGSNFGSLILYGADGDRGKRAGGRVAGAGMFTYPGDIGGMGPVGAGVCRVNSGRGVDASGVPGRDSKGDAPHVS